MRHRATASLLIVGFLTAPGLARGAVTRFESVPQIAPAWRATFTDTVRWQRVTAFGHLVVATDTGAHGMDPATGRVTWTRTELPNLPEDGFEEIAGTPLVVLGKGRERGRVVILDAADGRVRFHTHYPAPRLPAIVRELLRAQQVRAVLGSVASGVRTGAFAMSAADQRDGTTGQALSATIAEGYGQVTHGYAGAARKYAEAARSRFSATATAPGFVFMMVQFTRDDYGLAKVSHATGQIQGMVNMQRDKEPVYDVDTVANRLYCRQTPTEVVAFYW